MTTPISPKFCSTCGSHLAKDTAFCPSCGTSISPQTATWSASTERELPSPHYSLQGIGTAIRWVSGVALLPLCASILADLRQAALMADWIVRPSLITEWSFRSNWADAENTGLVSYQYAFLLGLAAFVLLIIWSWRASKNIQIWAERSGRDVRRGAGWAIGGWFIPIGNLWIPYQTIQDAWIRAPGSDDLRQQGDELPRSNIWLISWITWLIGNISSNLATRILVSGETASELRTAYLVSAFDQALTVVSAICLIITVKRISDRHAPGPGIRAFS